MSVDEKGLPPEQLFSRIEEFVTQSRELVSHGAMLEIEGLEARIESLCEMVLGLSQEDRLRYADKLQVLLADIGKLGEEMMALRDVMGDEIRSLTSVKKASVAYRVADASDSYGKRKDDENEG
jgi:hypothetical protein